LGLLRRFASRNDESIIAQLDPAIPAVVSLPDFREIHTRARSARPARSFRLALVRRRAAVQILS
jgi:hypothetical protein